MHDDVVCAHEFHEGGQRNAFWHAGGPGSVETDDLVVCAEIRRTLRGPSTGLRQGGIKVDGAVGQIR